LGVAWQTVQILRAFSEDEIAAFEKVLFPLILVVFLANDGLLLRNFTLGMRSTLNSVTITVLDNVAQESITQMTQLVQQKVGTIQFLNEQLEICASIVDSENTQGASPSTPTGNEQVDCIMQVYQQAEALGLQGESWFDSALSKIGEMISDPSKIVTAPLSSVVNGSIFIGLNIILTTFGIAFQWAIEISLIFVGILGGLVLGLALLPGQSKVVMTWITGMASLGLVKLGYNIMLGMTGMLMYKSESNDVLLMPLMMGVLAPFLSLGIGALSFMSLVNLAASMTSKGFSLAGGIAASGGRYFGGGASRLIGKGVGRVAGMAAGWWRNKWRRSK
jgi:hypothetical protein